LFFQAEIIKCTDPHKINLGFWLTHREIGSRIILVKTLYTDVFENTDIPCLSIHVGEPKGADHENWNNRAEYHHERGAA